jgi:integrase
VGAGGKQRSTALHDGFDSSHRREARIPGFTPHDLRRRCASKLGEMLVPGHLIDRITNHKPTGITDRVYNKYDYLREKRDALFAWGSKLAQLVSGLQVVSKDTSANRPDF